MKHWIAFFSQTGSEIVEISKKLNKWPDLICTNKKISSLDNINYELLSKCFSIIHFLPSTPSVEEYETVLHETEDSIITLNGYLRIIPPAVCKVHKMYNGHPGDIITHPTLKGKDPQKKAFDNKFFVTGSVIHSVTEELDGGDIEMVSHCNIDLDSLEETYRLLHENSVNLWVEFLTKKLRIRK